MNIVSKQHVIFGILLFSLVSCSSTAPDINRDLASSTQQQNTRISHTRPIIVENLRLEDTLRAMLKKNISTLSPDDQRDVLQKLHDYYSFLGLTDEDLKAAQKAEINPVSDDAATVSGPSITADPESADGIDDGDKTPSNIKAAKRLFASSTQFLFCPDLRNWDCLEQSPKLKPTAKFRLEPRPDLGAPVLAGNTLDMEVFFTQAWDNSPRAGVVDRLAERIRRDGTKSLSMALYGIDDIEGSMKPVYDAIVGLAQNSKSKVRGVVDIAGFERGPSPWIFGYRSPGQLGSTLDSQWMFGPANSGTGMHATFQYDGTPNIIRALNQGVASDQDARLRIEWPTAHIMHNKFMVLENNQGNKAVWTGTANISKNCMGIERNSNMSLYIRNNVIAQAFEDEFEQMYQYDPAVKAVSRLVVSADSASGLSVGRFHRNKLSLNRRYFKFNDGTNVRVHFAPTGDAEHRVILPMLLSAQKGDVIRVSMFGGTGYEIVRAFQLAAARGADVRIVFDRQLGYGATSWIRDPRLNLTMDNPYAKLVDREGAPQGSIQVRVSNWEGKNHYKAGSLTRKLANGKMLAEQIIVGSQNWSSGGNDYNDENLVSIQNLNSGVRSAERFNQEFDNRLWVKSRPYVPKASIR